MRRLYWKASYTVEAAFVVPIVLFAMCAVICLSLDLHEMVKQEAKDYEQLQIDTMDVIYQQDVMLELSKS